jgi:hypothetical protein
MNILIALSLTLLVVVAGMFLLSHTNKENLGPVYKVISYFVVVTGFIGFLIGICCGICRMHCNKQSCSKQEKMCCSANYKGCSQAMAGCSKMSCTPMDNMHFGKMGGEKKIMIFKDREDAGEEIETIIERKESQSDAPQTQQKK